MHMYNNKDYHTKHTLQIIIHTPTKYEVKLNCPIISLHKLVNLYTPVTRQPICHIRHRRKPACLHYQKYGLPVKALRPPAKPHLTLHTVEPLKKVDMYSPSTSPSLPLTPSLPPPPFFCSSKIIIMLLSLFHP